MRIQNACIAILAATAMGCGRPHCSESTMTTNDPTFTHAWTDANGRVHAFGPSVISHRLASDTWSDEPMPDSAYFGAGTNDAMWLLTERGPMYRNQGGPWVRTALANARGLYIGEDVRTVVVPEQSGPPASVQAWDGTGWHEVASMRSSDDYQDATFLPDGRAVLLSWDALVVQGTSGPLRVPLDDIWSYRIASAPDGTLVTFGLDIAVGTTHGLVRIEDQRPARWFEALPLSASNVWFLGRSYENQQSLVAHWNGTTLDVIHRTPHDLNALTALPDGSILALGGDRGRLVIRGDRAGFMSELDTLGITRPNSLTIDDTTGEPWAFGPHTAATGRSEFRPAATPHIPGDNSDFAISEGRTMYRGPDGLVVIDEGGESTYYTDRYVSVMCGAEGTLYAFSRNRVFRYSGSWESWTLDIPDWAQMTSCWAERSDKVFFGYDLDGFGYVAQWNDLRGLTVEVSDLEQGPRWMARQTDGFLWTDEGSMGPTRRWGGYDFERVTDMPPATTQTHLRSDGTLFALHGTEGLPMAHRISARDGESDPWRLLVQTTARLKMTGWGDDVWAVWRDGRDDVFWSSTCK